MIKDNCRAGPCAPRCRATGWPTFALAMLLLGPLKAGAQDTVYLSSATSSAGRTRVEGKVVDYSGAGLVVEVSGAPRQFPARVVQRIETPRTESQIQGDALYNSGDFAGALAAYRNAREDEERPWVRREITARIVWTYRALGQPTPAAEEFLVLVSADPATPYFDCIPLAWHGSFQSRAMTPTALRWLREESVPAAVLLGASYLLQTEHGSTAINRLQTLANSSDANVAHLARAQAWRTTILSAQASQVDRWEEMVDEMPAALRAGPYYIVGQGRLQNQEWLKAVLTLVRIPILYPNHRELAARSLFEAAAALAKLERHDEANRLYSELIQTYPGSPLVAEAQSRLKPPPGQ